MSAARPRGDDWSTQQEVPAGMIATNRAAGIAWGLLVCGAGVLSVALTQPRVALDRGRRGRRDRVPR
jgi:hypothetical protein